MQTFFRRAVLASYRDRCAISGVPLRELLNASHIVPWSADAKRRADPRNGIALHALYDRAFDCGYLTFDDELRVVVSRLLRVDRPSDLHAATLLAIEGRPPHPRPLSPKRGEGGRPNGLRPTRRRWRES